MSDLEPSRDHPRVPGPSLWPVGLALGIVVLLVGFGTSPWIISLGAVLVVVFGFLWVGDLARSRGLDTVGTLAPAAAPEIEAAPEPAPTVAEAESYTRE